jgi:hypothetical protein
MGSRLPVTAKVLAAVFSGKNCELIAEHGEGTAKRIVRHQQVQFSPRLPWLSLKTDRRAGSGGQIVAMVQATEPWDGDDTTIYVCTHCHLTACWRLFIQPKMRSALVVVANVFPHQPAEVMFVHHDHMVKQIAAEVSYPAFCDTVPPRTPETCFCFGSMPKFFTVPMTSVLNVASRSKIRYFGAESNGTAPRNR